MDKNIYKFIFYLLFFASYESRGQVMFNDGFEDQQFGSWENSSQWDITSLTPIAGNYSLHHNLTGVRSSSFISRKIPTKGFNDGIITWHLKLKNGNWIFGATEQFCFYLVSDRAEIPAANGYAIGINLAGGDNRMTLCRMSGGISVEVIVQTDLKWEPGMSLEIEVIHEYGSWKIRNKVEAATVWSEEKIGDEKLLDFILVILVYYISIIHLMVDKSGLMMFQCPISTDPHPYIKFIHKGKMKSSFCFLRQWTRCPYSKRRITKSKQAVALRLMFSQ